MQHETILVLDFGGQYNQLIARRVRDAGVYSVVKSYRTPLEEIRAAGYKGIIFTGGPNSVYADDSPGMTPPSCPWACPCWAFATAPSLWPGCWTARWSPLRANTAKPRCR